MSKIKIRRCPSETAVYEVIRSPSDEVIATIRRSSDKSDPHWMVVRKFGRVDRFDTLAEAKDEARKI